VRVAAIILHFRFWPQVCQTVDALLAQTRPPDRVIIVDNASDDGSAENLKAAYRTAHLLEAASNGGYAAGMNLGMRCAADWGADAMLLLTAECLLAPNALEVLTNRLEEDSALAATGPLVAFLSQPGKVFSAGGSIDKRTWDVRHLRAGADMDDVASQPPQRVDWLDGCCLLLRTEAVRQAGPIEESYFIQFEEVEYLLRLQLQGWTVECVPSSVAWQEPGSGFRRLMVRNRLRFVFRNAPRRVAAREFIRQFYYLCLDWLKADREARGQARSRALGIMDYLLGHRGSPPGFARGYNSALSRLKARNRVGKETEATLR
jgi:GT2 family glycosyltransferase